MESVTLTESRAGKVKAGIIFVVGSALILLGLSFNVAVAGRLFTEDGTLSRVGYIIVWLFDIGTVTAGALLLYYRRPIASRLIFSRAAVVAWCLVLVLSFGMLEVAARVVDRLYDSNFSGEKGRLLSRDIVPYRIFGFYQYGHAENGDVVIVSSKGRQYNLSKPEDGTRIVAFGGSTTQQDAPGSEDYPKLLEEKLQSTTEKPVEVINVGNVSYATTHSLTLLTLDVISWDADVVILSHNINDLLNSYVPGFTPDYSHVFSLPIFTRGRNASEYVSQRLFGWSTLYWVVKHQVGRIALPLIKEKLSGEAYERTSFGDSLPEESKDIFKRNLHTFIDVAQAHDIDVILATQPFEPSLEYWDRTMRFHLLNKYAVYPLHEELVAHHGELNQIIRDVAHERGVYLVDNAADFEGHAEFFRDHVHYTKEGLERLANNYFAHITKWGLAR